MADNRTMEELLQAPTEGRTPNIVKPELRTILEVAPMADNRTMEELLQAPTEGDVLNDVVKLMMFPYSLEGSARGWMNTNSKENASKTDDRIDKHADQISTLVDICAKKVVTPALVKVVEESSVTSGGPHAHFNCDDTNSNQPSVCVTTSTYNQGAPQNRASNYMAPPVNRIDIIDVARVEYAQEILGFSKKSSGGNPNSTSEPIIFDSSPSFTSFEGSDFILEEIEAYLNNESISLEIDHADCDPEGDIYLIEKLLNNGPFQLPPMDLKQGEVVKVKSSIEEPSKLELKDLPSHLEYAYLEGVDKLPVIIVKDLKDDEKESLLKVLKSHKRAIAWKITYIKGINPRFCIHKILMEEDYKHVVQSQRWVNPKIHEVIKKEGIKLLDAEMIYLISDSPLIARPMTHLLEKETPFVFSKDCIDAFETLKKKLTEAPILVVPDWNLPFKLIGQVEVSNRGLKRILERTVEENHASWSEKLEDALWAFRTAYKTPIGCTPYKLVYGKSCHLPIELEHKAYRALKHVNFDLKTAEKTKKLRDSKIKNRIFNVGDRVLLFNSRLKIFSGKLKTRWSGPFTITQVFSYGTVELSQPEGLKFKVNSHCVKHYFRGDVPQLVVPDLQIVPMENECVDRVKLCDSLEKRRISSLAPFLGYGGSGDGEGSLPRGFRGLLLEKKGKKVVQVWAGSVV
nr:reverse transcriptase domain-containing protein [Tanacetum cinerariifolium]